jgi:hypothetical protein
MARKAKLSTKNSLARRFSDRSFRVLLACLFLTAFLVICLALLTWWQKEPARRPDSSGPGRPPASDAQKRDVHDRVQLELERALWRAQVSFDDMAVVRRDGLLLYRLSAVFPGDAWFEDLEAALSRVAPQARVARNGSEAAEVVISLGGVPRFLLRFRRAQRPRPVVLKRGQVAIIVDDLGIDLPAARALLALDLPLTMAVLPEERHTREVAELAHARGREVLVHIPMEPESYPQNDPGRQALLLGLSQEEIRLRLRSHFRKVPHAVGGNNHMGSRFTQYNDGMRTVMQVLRQENRFFVDSRTSPHSVAPVEARRAGVPIVCRDLFLDNRRDVEVIGRELRKLVRMGRDRNQAIGICHPYPETVQALQLQCDWIKRQGVDIVPVSRLVKPPVR